MVDGVDKVDGVDFAVKCQMPLNIFGKLLIAIC